MQGGLVWLQGGQLSSKWEGGVGLERELNRGMGGDLNFTKVGFRDGGGGKGFGELENMGK